MTLIFRLIIRRDIWIFHSKVFSSDYKTKTKQKFSGFLVEFQDFIKIEKKIGSDRLSQTSKVYHRCNYYIIYSPQHRLESKTTLAQMPPLFQILRTELPAA